MKHNLGSQAMTVRGCWILMLKANRSGHHQHNNEKKDYSS